MLGTLAHYAPADAVGFAGDGRLDRLMLHRLGELDEKVRDAYANFDYARVVAALSAFMNADLSAFYFDIRKDALYCEPPSSVKRRGALEAIEHIFRAVTIWLAPILVFTSEESWAARDADARSVHLEHFPDIPAQWRDEALAAKWETIRRVRSVVTGAIEIARADKDRLVAGGEPARLYRRSDSARGAGRRRLRRGLHHLRSHDRERARARPKRLSPRRYARRGRRGRARRGRQMRALLALFRSRDRRSRISRRHPARRGGAARIERDAAGLMRARTLGGWRSLVVLALDQASKFAVVRDFDRDGGAPFALAPFLDLALRWNRGISFSLFTQDRRPGVAAAGAYPRRRRRCSASGSGARGRRSSGWAWARSSAARSATRWIG